MQRNSRSGSLLPLFFVLIALIALVVALSHFDFARREPRAAHVSPRDPAQKERAWEADGAHEAILGAKEACAQAATRLLNLSPVTQWDDPQSAGGIETSPGRYRVKRQLVRQNGLRDRTRTTFDCRIRRDGDHFQLIAIDSTPG